MPEKPPATVAKYLAALPPAVRAEVEAVRAVMLANLDAGYEEGIQYGMIGYYVPHRVYPAGYHCDPKQPLPFAALGAKKNYVSLHLMPLYGDTEASRWFHGELARTGRKIDVGAACIRFRAARDLPLDLIGAVVARTPAKKYIAACEDAVARRKSAKPTKPAKKKA